MQRTNIDAPYLKLMLYGAPGSTKTRTAATAALDERTSPVLWLDLAGNPQSIRTYPKKPDMLTLETLTDLNDPYEFLSEGQDPEHPFAKEWELKPPYKTLVIDGITEIQRHSIRKVTGSTNNKPGDLPAKMQLQNFGAILNHMINLVDLYYKLPMNVIFTCLEWARTSDGPIQYVPLLVGQAVDQVPAYALMVMRLVHRTRIDNRLRAMDDTLGAEETVSIGLLTPGGNYYAKDQYGMGVDYVVNPSISDLLDQIQKTGEATPDK